MKKEDRATPRSLDWAFHASFVCFSQTEKEIQEQTRARERRERGQGWHSFKTRFWFGPWIAEGTYKTLPQGFSPPWEFLGDATPSPKARSKPKAWLKAVARARPNQARAQAQVWATPSPRPAKTSQTHRMCFVLSCSERGPAREIGRAKEESRKEGTQSLHHPHPSRVFLSISLCTHSFIIVIIS